MTIDPSRDSIHQTDLQRSNAMTTQTTTRQTSIRALFVAIALLLASIFASSPVSAGTLIPMVDMGGPGGGGSGATQTVDIADSNVPGIREF